MKLAYIDSCVWISWVEGPSEYKKTVSHAMRELAEENWTYCISDAIILEVLANPLRNQNAALVNAYQRLFEHCRNLKIPTSVFQDALSIASAENLKGMDAVHVAIAKRQGCQRFVSTDPHFARLRVLTPYWIQLNIP
jgi:predicted nucleic acid-binding protein